MRPARSFRPQTPAHARSRDGGVGEFARKAVGDYRSPILWREAEVPRMRGASWSAPVLWSFGLADLFMNAEATKNLPLENDKLLRWLALPFALFFGFMLSFPFAFSSYLVLESLPHSPDSILRYLWEEPYVGFICAFTWMTITLLIAPSPRFLAVILSFAVGLYVATWFIPITTYYPESYPWPYADTHFPIIVTCLGGALPVMAYPFRGGFIRIIRRIRLAKVFSTARQ